MQPQFQLLPLHQLMDDVAAAGAAEAFYAADDFAVVVVAVVVAAVAVVVTDFLETSWRKIWIEIEQSPKQDRNLQAGRRIEKDADASGEVLEMTKVS